jgi:hypothetical protein
MKLPQVLLAVLICFHLPDCALNPDWKAHHSGDSWEGGLGDRGGGENLVSLFRNKLIILLFLKRKQKRNVYTGVVYVLEQLRMEVEYGSTERYTSACNRPWKHRMGYRYNSTRSLTSAVDMGGWLRHASASLFPVMTRYLLCRKLGGPQGSVCTENFAPTGIQFPDRPARSESLYWLSYSGIHMTAVEVVFVLYYEHPDLSSFRLAHIFLKLKIWHCWKAPGIFSCGSEIAIRRR